MSFIDRPIMLALPTMRYRGPYRSTAKPTGGPREAPMRLRVIRPPVSIARDHPHSSLMGLKKKANV